MNERLCKQCLILKELQFFNKSGKGKYKRSCRVCQKSPKDSNLDIFEIQIIEKYLLDGIELPFDYLTINHSINKLCTSCHEIKICNEYRERLTKNGIDRYQSHVCKSCESAHSLRYNQEHSEEIQAYQKMRVETGADSIMRKNRAEKYLQTFLWRKARQNAKQRNKEFNIEVSDILIPEKCPLLDIPLQVNIGMGTNRRNSYSIDRIDSSKGYIKGNIQILSQLANTMKNCATQEQLLTFAKNIIEIYKDEDIV